MGVPLHETLPSGGENDADKDGYGGVVAIWNYSTHLYAQRVDSSGVVLWETTGVPVCTTMNTNDYQQVIGDLAGGAIATWYGDPNMIVFNNVYAQRVNANGIPGGVTGEPVEENRPVKLFMNIFPNPSKGRTEVEFSLAKPAFVELAVYNMLGQRVRTLVNSYKNAGRHKISWNGRDNVGNEVSSGVYFYRLKAGEHNAAKKMMVIK
ncbi:MAG: T9SS type A sorting domain-containing protein [Candidatus Edwardsbacteria bacterium]|nr:T9SS type A sorting domain-containing protein [Candidatus Edwardsbacteria bacterium]